MKKPELVKVTSGDPVSLDCKVTGSPELKVRWLKEGKELQSIRQHKLSFENNISSLKIKSVQREDEGDYVFEVSNHISSCSCTVKVVVARCRARPLSPFPGTAMTRNSAAGPPATSPSVTTAAPSGYQPSSSCALPEMNKGTNAQPSDGVKKTSALHTHAGQFTIRSRPRSRSGRNRPELIQRHCVLPAEGTATFIAKVGGEPIPSIKWMKGKWRQLTQGGRISIEQTARESKLEIREVTKSDSGQYRCVASNAHGEIECAADLHVDEKKAAAQLEGDLRAKLKKSVRGTPSKQKSPEADEDIDIIELLRNVDPKEYEKYARMYGITDYRGLLQAIEHKAFIKQLYKYDNVRNEHLVSFLIESTFFIS
uniref:Ig-like domain-containing protein n=1 Tax=Hippocampus comes TaxID=109280 RepID=A0A3Q2ZHH0_HIPCM